MQSSVEPTCKHHQIPPEVIDYIIDYCHQEEGTLRTCSLVCKGWLPSSRYHLFSTIMLDCSNVSSFIALLESPSGSSIGPLITQLGLRIEYNPCLIESIPALSSYLRPTSLQLTIFKDSINTSGIRSMDLTTLINAFQTVTSLCISIYCNTFIEIAEIVTSFPLLRHLVFHGEWDMESEVEFPLGEYALPSHLQTLECYPADPYFFHWLLGHLSVPRPSTLGLGIWNTSDLGLIGRYLRELSETLQHLSIKADSQFLLSGDMDLRYLSHLRTINIRVPKNEISIILYLLSRVNSVSIEAIGFAVWDPTDDPAALWDELDELLTSPRFPRLLRVTVNGYPKYHTDIRSRLRCLNSKNMLHLRWSYRH